MSESVIFGLCAVSIVAVCLVWMVDSIAARRLRRDLDRAQQDHEPPDPE